MKQYLFAGLAAALATTGIAGAQTGADGCTTPDVVVGAGPFNFDNTAGTTGAEGQTEASCLFFGSTALTRDVWFVWNANVTGTVNVNTCGLTTVDTKIAVYAANTCPTAGTAVACNDDACVGFQTTTTLFSVTAGTDYVIQIGTYPFPAGVGDPGGTGQFSINIVVPPTNDGCATPVNIPAPGTATIDTTFASTGAEGQTEALCLGAGSTAIYKDVWYTYTPTTNGTVTVSTCGLITTGTSQDSRIAVYAGTGCPAAGTAVACNDDFTCTGFSGLNATVSFTAVCGTTYLFQVGAFGATANIIGSVSVTETGGSSCATPFTAYCFGDGTGTACPCANSGVAGNGCANGINPNGANLTATGNASISGDTWQLSATGIPNGPGLYFQGTTQLNAGNGNPFGDGLRCAGGSIIRLGIVTGVANASTYPSPNPPAVNAIPISLKGLNVAGNIRNYQLWYRDSTAGFCTASVFNLTNAVNMTWLP